MPVFKTPYTFSDPVKEEHVNRQILAFVNEFKKVAVENDHPQVADDLAFCILDFTKRMKNGTFNRYNHTDSENLCNQVDGMLHGKSIDYTENSQ